MRILWDPNLNPVLRKECWVRGIIVCGRASESLEESNHRKSRVVNSLGYYVLVTGSLWQFGDEEMFRFVIGELPGYGLERVGN